MRHQRTATIRVANLNGQVQFPTIAPIEIFEGQSIKLRIAATDPETPGSTNNPLVTEGDFFADQESFIPPLIYRVEQLPIGATYDVETQIFEWTPSFNQAGLSTIAFHVEDDGDGTGVPTADELLLNIRVLDSNGRPVISTVNNQTVDVGKTLEIPIRAVDSDGQSLALSASIGQASSLPSWATLIDNGDGTGRLTVAPQPGDRNSYLVTLMASEIGGTTPLGTSTQFILTVNSPNEPPKFVQVFDHVGLTGKSIDIPIQVSDADQDPLQFAVEGLPTGAVFETTSVYGLARLKWTPDVSSLGTYNLTFRVTDSGNGNSSNAFTATRSMVLKIRESNSRPALDPIGEQTIAEGQTLVLQLTSSDPEGDSLFFQAKMVEGTTEVPLPRGAQFDSATGRFVWTPGLDQAGSYRIRMVVTDGAGQRSEDVLVRVTSTNQAPTFLQTPLVFGREGEPIFFSVLAADADEEPLVYRLDRVRGDWTSSGLPPGVRFDASSNTLRWDADFESAGQYLLDFTATDPNGATAETTVRVKIFPTNRAPDVTLPAVRKAEIGRLIEIPILVSDLDGDVVTLHATDLPEGAVLGGDGILRWTPTGFQAGEHTIRIFASDGDRTTQRNITLLASFSPSAPDVRIVVTPSFPAIPQQKVIIEPIVESDVEVRSLTVTIDGKPIQLNADRRIEFSSKTLGKFEVVATATDIEGRVRTVTRSIFVRDPLDTEPPVISMPEIQPRVLTEPVNVTIGLHDSTLATYTVEMVSLADGRVSTIASGSSGSSIQVSLEPSHFSNGFYRMVVRAADLGGLSSEASVDLEINSGNKTGQLKLIENDFAVLLAGIPIHWNRVYDSLESIEGSVGLNAVDIEGVNHGTNWQLPFIYPSVALSKASQTSNQLTALKHGERLYLTLPDGSRVGFTFEPEEIETELGSFFRPKWRADQGVLWSLSTFDRVLQKPGGDEAYYMTGSGLPYNLALDHQNSGPSSTLMLTSPNGQVYGYRVSGETALGPRFVLERITSNGQRFVRFTDSGFTADDGERISIIRDSFGRVSEIVLPENQSHTYRYDDRGRLVSTSDHATRERTLYGYGQDGRLIANVPNIGTGVHYRYSGNSNSLQDSKIVHKSLGGTREFLQSAIEDTLREDAQTRFALTISEAELRSSATGSITIGVEVSSQSFDPAVALLEGVEAGFALREAGRSVALFTIARAGTYVLTIGAQANGQASDGFQRTIFLAGDANGDRSVDALDPTVFELANGSDRGDGNYVEQADANRDGVVNAQDAAAIWASYGFVANRAPIPRAHEPVISYGGEPVLLDAQIGFTSNEEERLDFAMAGVAPLPTRYLGAGFFLVDPISTTSQVVNLPLLADDGLLVSTSNVAIEVVEVDWVGLQISSVDPILNAGQTISLSIHGLRSSGESILIDPRSIAFTSLDPNVAMVTDAGQIIALRNGFSVIEIRAFGLVAATSITVGVTVNPKVDFFPDAYTVGIGTEHRQLIVREQVGDSVIDRTSVASFFVEDPSIGEVDSNARFVGKKVGSTRVTFVYNGHTQISQFDVVDLTSGSSTTTGNDSQILESPSGIQLGIPAESFPVGTTVSVEPMLLSEIPFGAPFGFDPLMAFNLDFQGEQAKEGLSLSVPTPSSLNPGDTAWLFTASTITDANGQSREAWLLTDRMMAGEDGRLRTTSPPHPTIIFSGPQIIMGAAFAPGLLFGISRALQGAQVVVESPFAGGLSKPYYTIVGFDFNSITAYFLPVPSSQPVKVTQRVVGRNGLANEDVRILEFTPGEQREETIELTAPADSPVLDDLEVTSLAVLPGVDPSLQVNYLQALDFEKIKVRYKVGDNIYTGRLQRNVEADPQNPNSQSYLLFEIPNEVTLASAEISFGYYLNVDTDFFDRLATSKTFSVTPDPRFVFSAIASPAAVAVIDARSSIQFGDNAVDNPVENELIASIPMAGSSTGARAVDTATTLDNGRVYVLLEDGVAVLDAVALQQIDTIAGGNVNRIALPAGAVPYRIELFEFSAGRGYAYISDRIHGSIYVVDIDPESATYHQLMSTIPVPNAPLGLRGLAIDRQTSNMFVAIPGKTLFQSGDVGTGKIAVYSLFNPTFPRLEKIIQDVGVSPSDIQITTTPNKVLVTDQVQDASGLMVVELSLDYRIVTVEEVDLTKLGLDPGARGRQTFSLSNATGVTFIPENAYQKQIGPHPSYALITAYNRHIPDDPKHDQNGEPLFIRNALGGILVDPSFLNREATTRSPGFAIAAGGNVGLIRDPLGTYGLPTVVGATRTTPKAFPDNLTVAGLNVYSAYRGNRAVVIHNAAEMIRTVERGTITKGDQTNVPIDKEILNRIPIDDLNRAVDIRTNQFVQYVIQGGSAVGIVNPHNPTQSISLSDGTVSNSGAVNVSAAQLALVYGPYPHFDDGDVTLPKAPLGTGGMPFGVSAQAGIAGLAIDPRDNPYNLKNSRCDCQEWKIRYEAASEVEGHSGALTESVSITPYQVAGLSIAPTFVYDSERANPSPIFHVGMIDVKPLQQSRVLAARAEAKRDDVSIVSEGFDPAEQGQINPFQGGENFFRVPTSGGKVEAAIQLDMSNVPSGIYSVELSQGIYANSGVGFVGDFAITHDVVAVVNSIESPFGAGWGLQGWKMIFEEAENQLLLVDGDGSDSIFSLAEDNLWKGPDADQSEIRKSNGVYVRTMHDGVQQIFDSQNRLQRIRFRDGTELTYGYNISGQVATMSDPTGGIFQFAYAGGRISSVTDPAGRITRFVIDGAGNLTQMIHPDGAKREFTYEGKLLRKSIDENRNAYSHEFDFAGRIKSTQRPDGAIAVFEPAQVKGLFPVSATKNPLDSALPSALELGIPSVKTVDYRGLVTKTELDGNGRPLSSVDSVGVIQTSLYDEAGRTSSVHSSTNRVEFAYDLEKNANLLADDIGLISSATFTNGRLTAKQDAAGVVTSYATNDLGQRTKMSIAGVVQYTYTYNLLGQTESVTDGLGNKSVFTYDERGRMISELRADGVQLDFTYDANGYMNSRTDGNGNRYLMEYDVRGRLLQETDPLGNKVKRTYDARGNVISITDPRGLVTTLQYDSMNRVVQTIYPSGGKVLTTYDSNGNILSETDLNGNKTSYQYDLRGRRVAKIDAKGNAWSYQFDSDDNLIAETDPKGGRAVFEYDSRGRVIAETSPTGSTFRYEFDAADRRILEIDAIGAKTRYEYDSLGRLSKTTDALGGIERTTYDAIGNVLTQTDRLGRTTAYTYDSLNRRTSVTDANGGVTRYFYDGEARVIRTIDALGHQTETIRDAIGRPIVKIDSLGNRTVYEYDASSNLVRMVNAIGQVTAYEYDTLNRKTAVVDSLGNRNEVLYDDAGNITRKIDPLGNSVQFEYDSLNNPIRYIDAEGFAWTYQYDELSNRISTTDPEAGLRRPSTMLVHGPFARLTPLARKPTWCMTTMGKSSSLEMHWVL